MHRGSTVQISCMKTACKWRYLVYERRAKLGLCIIHLCPNTGVGIEEFSDAWQKASSMPTCYKPTIRPFQQPKQSRTLLQSWRSAGRSMARRSQHSQCSDSTEALIQYSCFPGHTSLRNKREEEMEEVEKRCHTGLAHQAKQRWEKQDRTGKK